MGDCHLFADESRVLVVEVGVVDCHLLADESLDVEVSVLDCHLLADESGVLVVEVGVWTVTCLLMRAEYLS